MSGDRCLAFRLNFGRRGHNPYAIRVDESYRRENFGCDRRTLRIRALTTVFADRFSARESPLECADWPFVISASIGHFLLQIPAIRLVCGTPHQIADRIFSVPGLVMPTPKCLANLRQMRAEPWTGLYSRITGVAG